MISKGSDWAERIGRRPSACKTEAGYVGDHVMLPTVYTVNCYGVTAPEAVDASISGSATLKRHGSCNLLHI